MSNSTNVDSVLDALFAQIWMGNTHLLIWEQVNKTLAAEPELAGRSSAFFQFTLRAHIDAALLHLARLLDRHRDAVSLPYLLRIAGSRSTQFRHQQKETVQRAVEEDQARLDGLRGQIHALEVRRNKQIAHLDKANIKNAAQLMAESDLTLANVQTLYSTVWEIVCRYSAYWRDSSVFNEMIGWDDFKDLAQVALKGIDLEKVEWRARCEKFERLVDDAGKGNE